MTAMKPCPKCHSTEHLRIGIIDDNPTAGRSAKAGCTGCHAFAQIDYVLTRQGADGCRPSDIQSTRGVKYRRGCCDSAVIFTEKCEPEAMGR